jgi:hypothetical protein
MFTGGGQAANRTRIDDSTSCRVIYMAIGGKQCTVHQCITCIDDIALGCEYVVDICTADLA